MRAILMSVLIHYPSQHLSTSVIIKVGINIGKIHTIWIEKTLKQKVVFQGVYLRNSQAISYHGACCRATPRANHDTQIGAGSIDKVLNYEEISRETHGLHHVKFEVNMLADIVRNRVAIKPLCTIIG